MAEPGVRNLIAPFSSEPNGWKYFIASITVMLVQALLIVALFRQRSRKRKAETALANSEEKFSKTFRQSPLVLAISRTSDSRFIELNECFEELTGWKRDEAIGRTPAELQLWANADERAAFLNQIQANGSLRDLEAHMRTKDGEIRTLLVSAEVVDVAGQRCTLSVGADITERKQAEQALIRKDAELAEAQRLAKLGSWRWEVATDTVIWSEELYRISGLDPSLPAPSYREHPRFYTAESWDRLRRAVEEALNSGAPYELDLEMVRTDGAKRWLLARGAAQRDTEGRVVQLYGTVQDITERKAAEEMVRDMSGRLITAHEEERRRIARELHDNLSQRMALLQINVQQFEQGATELSSMAREKLNNITEIASEISSDIHDLSHRLHPSKLDIMGLVPSLISLCREFSESHRLGVYFSHEHVPNQIPKNVTLCLFRIVQEALQNVVKHSGAEEVKVNLSGCGDRIELCVFDSGVGFDPESEKGKEGLGLLSMSERLRSIGGTFSVESEPSRGARIRVRIPLPVTGAQITNKAEA
jgi:PAS domain S-box-containing protein